MKTRMSKVLLISIMIISTIGIQTSLAGFQDTKKENRKVNEFSSVVFAISGNLYLSQGDKNEVIIEADDDILEKIITEVRGDRLVIEFERWYNYRGNGKINVYVTTKNIEEITLTGSGTVTNKTPINSSDIELAITGSGSIMIDRLITKNVKSMISGSGDIKISSDKKAATFNATITGSGDINATSIEFEKGKLTITGSGSIKASIVEDLRAVITGSGKIVYMGKPLIDADITGSGKIVNGN